MNLRDALGSLQLPVATFGVLLTTGAIYSLMSMPPSPPNSDGFIEGLAFFFFGLISLCGFVVTSGGLAIPPGNGVGIRFNNKQRWLFIIAAAAAIGTIILPLFGYGGAMALAPGNSLAVLVYTWLGLSAIALLSFVGAVSWRLGEAASPRLVRGLECIRERVKGE